MAKDDTSYADRRRAAIEEAAYLVLAEKGYKGASMLEIAKRAGASNETLYKWYGNKQGLFRALVEINAARVTEQLDAVLDGDDGGDPVAGLEAVGIALLSVLTSEKAVALNRAAAGDVHDTGTLGKALAEAGRGSVLPRIAGLFERALDDGALEGGSAQDIADTWLSLLVGDLQVRLVTGQVERPVPSEIKRQSKRALEATKALFAAC
ncbi:MAG: TetR/AcrR family transcriptional regulator [Pseudomonadota bacterium]